MMGIETFGGENIVDMTKNCFKENGKINTITWHIDLE